VIGILLPEKDQTSEGGKEELQQSFRRRILVIIVHTKVKLKNSRGEGVLTLKIAVSSGG
jgi:hypothetical protein